jgi:hypothetical protein
MPEPCVSEINTVDMQKIFLSSVFLSGVHSRRKSTTRCGTDDIHYLGGGGMGVVNSLTSCIPDAVSEANLEQIESCVEMSFIPVSLSEDCNRCSIAYLESHELELKSCLMKCSGPARSSNMCQKCKDTIGTSWDEACLPTTEADQILSHHSTNHKMKYTYLVLTILLVVFL